MLAEGKEVVCRASLDEQEAPSAGSTSTVQPPVHSSWNRDISVRFWEVFFAVTAKVTLASSRSDSLLQKFANSKGGRTTQGDEVGMGSSLLPDPDALLNYRTFLRWYVSFCKYCNSAAEDNSQRNLHTNHDNNFIFMGVKVKGHLSIFLSSLCLYCVLLLIALIST